MNEKILILIKISLKFVPKGPSGNKAALVQMMAWRQIHWLIYVALGEMSQVQVDIF